MIPQQDAQKALIERLREHAKGWLGPYYGAPVETWQPEAEDMNETAMARDCWKAADALEALSESSASSEKPSISARIESVLFETDLPDLVLARDAFGTRYLCCLVNDRLQFVAIAISETRLVDLKSDRRDLRSVLLNPEAGIHYGAEFYREGDVSMLRMTAVSEVPEAWLPNDGFFLAQFLEPESAASSETQEERSDELARLREELAETNEALAACQSQAVGRERAVFETDFPEVECACGEAMEYDAHSAGRDLFSCPKCRAFVLISKAAQSSPSQSEETPIDAIKRIRHERRVTLKEAKRLYEAGERPAETPEERKDAASEPWRDSPKGIIYAMIGGHLAHCGSPFSVPECDKAMAWLKAQLDPVSGDAHPLPTREEEGR